MNGHVTIRTVARTAGVSVSTVSAAFNPGARISPATRAAVLEVAERLGWQPDRRAVHLRRSVGSVVGMIYEVTRPYQITLIDAVYAAAAEYGLEVLLAGASRHHSEDDCLALLLAERCRAVVFTGSSLSPEVLAEAARAVPVLALARRSQVPGADCVYCDPAEGERLAVAHLVELGHRNIAHVGGRSRSMAPEREAAYREAMRRAGLGELTTVFHSGDDLEAGVRAADALVRFQPRPTAVTCYNDAVAHGLVMRLWQYGVQVPRDISVVGYNDLPVAASPTLELTTVRQDPQALADRAFEVIASRVKAGQPALSGQEQAVALPSVLVVRGSTGPAPS